MSKVGGPGEKPGNVQPAGTAGQAGQINKSEGSVRANSDAGSGEKKESTFGRDTVDREKRAGELLGDKPQLSSGAGPIKAGSALDLHRMAAGLDAVGDLAEGVVERGRDLAEDAVDRGRDVIERGRDVIERGRDVVERGRDAVEDTVERGRDVVERGVERLEDGAERLLDGAGRVADSVRDRAVEAYRGAADAIDPTDQIRALDSDGDTYTVGLGASVSGEGAKVTGKGQIEVKRVDDPQGGGQPSYVVSLSGEGAAGIYGELGGKLGGKASLEGEVMLGAGGKVEMTFDNPEDAARAVQIMEREAIVQAAGQMKGGQVLGPVARAAIGPSAEDREWLTGHTTALELKGGAAARGAAALGIQLDEDQLKLAGANLGAEVTSDHVLRVELPQRDENGQVTRGARVTHRTEDRFALAGGAGVGLDSGRDDNLRGFRVGAGVGASGEVKVTTTQTWELPADVTGESLLDDPVDTLRSAAGGARQVEDSVRINLKGRAGVSGDERGAELELKTDNMTMQELLDNGGMELLRGDVEGALRGMGDRQVEWRLDTFETTGLDIKPSISVMGFGGGIEARMGREDHDTRDRGSITADQVADAIFGD